MSNLLFAIASLRCSRRAENAAEFETEQPRAIRDILKARSSDDSDLANMDSVLLKAVAHALQALDVSTTPIGPRSAKDGDGCPATVAIVLKYKLPFRMRTRQFPIPSRLHTWMSEHGRLLSGCRPDEISLAGGGHKRQPTAEGTDDEDEAKLKVATQEYNDALATATSTVKTIPTATVSTIDAANAATITALATSKPVAKAYKAMLEAKTQTYNDAAAAAAKKHGLEDFDQPLKNTLDMTPREALADNKKRKYKVNQQTQAVKFKYNKRPMLPRNLDQKDPTKIPDLYVPRVHVPAKGAPGAAAPSSSAPLTAADEEREQDYDRKMWMSRVLDIGRARGYDVETEAPEDDDGHVRSGSNFDRAPDRKAAQVNLRDLQSPKADVTDLHVGSFESPKHVGEKAAPPRNGKKTRCCKRKVDSPLGPAHVEGTDPTLAADGAALDADDAPFNKHKTQQGAPSSYITASEASASQQRLMASKLQSSRACSLR